MKLLAFLFLICITTSANSQTHHIAGIFPTVDLSYDLNEKWNLESYSFISVFPKSKSIGFSHYPSHAGALYTELDLTYNVNSHIGFTASYTYERANPFEDTYRNEHRVWLQGTHKARFKKFEIKNRFRYDFRFIWNRFTNNVDFNPRFRYLLGISHPIGKKVNAPVLVVYNEVFLNTFKNSPAFYGENWAFAGAKFRLSDGLQLEVGYLNISWVRDFNKNWLSQHFGQATFIANLNKAKN